MNNIELILATGMVEPLKEAMKAFGFVKMLVMIGGPISLGILYYFKNQGVNFNVNISERKLEKIKMRHAKEVVTVDGIEKNLMVSNGNRYFTGHVKIEGKDIRMLNLTDKVGLVNTTQSIFAAQQRPYSYHVQNRKVEYSRQMELFETARSRNEDLLAKEQIKLATLLEQRCELGQGSDEKTLRRLEILSKEINKKERQIDTLSYGVRYAEANLAYVGAVEKVNTGVKKNAFVCVSYDYNKANFVSGQLEEWEITNKGDEETSTILNTIASRLSACGVRARRLTNEELEVLAYKHWHPVKAKTMSKRFLTNLNRDYWFIKDPLPKQIQKVAHDEKVNREVVRQLEKMLNDSKAEEGSENEKVSETKN